MNRLEQVSSLGHQISLVIKLFGITLLMINAEEINYVMGDLLADRDTHGKSMLQESTP